jgi:hypothetical protein
LYIRSINKNTMKNLITLLIVLLSISGYSQENYYDTIIEKLINQKINEYRIEKGLHPFIETDSLKSKSDLYVKQHAEKLSMWINHSDIKGREMEVICLTPSSPPFETRLDGYRQIRSADSIATAIVEGYKGSRGHNVAILSRACVKFTTSVYVYYNSRTDFQQWKVFTATQIIEVDYDLYEKNKHFDDPSFHDEYWVNH